MLWHQLTAWNTGGEGIHSPRLFYLVRHLFYDTSRLYSWDAIEQRREAMLRAPKMIHITDYGTGQDRDELVMHIARRSLMGAREAQLLARLLHYMSGREYVVGRQRGLQIIELGTSLGLTTAYLASASRDNHVVSFEGSEEIAAMATLNWNKLALHNIEQKIGNIDDTLFIYAREEKPKVDFALLDANHTGQATLAYFECLLPLMDPDGVIVIDDIRLSPSMYDAWQRIMGTDRVTAAMDLGRMGIVFFCPNLQKRSYRLRI